MPRPKDNTVDMKRLTQYFDMPIDEAAKRLGVCQTVVKRVCRENGVNRWPYRLINSYNKTIEQLEEQIRTSDESAVEHLRMELEAQRKKKEFLINNPHLAGSETRRRRPRTPGSGKSKDSKLQDDESSDFTTEDESTSRRPSLMDIVDASEVLDSESPTISPSLSSSTSPRTPSCNSPRVTLPLSGAPLSPRRVSPHPSRIASPRSPRSPRFNPTTSSTTSGALYTYEDQFSPFPSPRGENPSAPCAPSVNSPRGQSPYETDMLMAMDFSTPQIPLFSDSTMSNMPTTTSAFRLPPLRNILPEHFEANN